MVHARRYSEEEVRALEHPPADVSLLANVAVPPAAAAAAAAAPEPSESAPAMAVADPAVVKRQLMASIPKDREGVFSFPIKWEVLDRAGLEVKGRIAGASRISPCEAADGRPLTVLPDPCCGLPLVSSSQAGCPRRSRT